MLGSEDFQSFSSLSLGSTGTCVTAVVLTVSPCSENWGCALFQNVVTGSAKMVPHWKHLLTRKALSVLEVGLAQGWGPTQTIQEVCNLITCLLHPVRLSFIPGSEV